MLLTRIHSNLDPLKYSVGVTRIGKLRDQLKAFRKFDDSFYLTFDRFASDLGRIATRLQTALDEGADSAQVLTLRRQIQRKVEKLESEVSTILREVMKTYQEVQI